MGKILDRQKTDMELAQFATLFAVKGTQFGKDVYSSVIKFNDLQDFLAVFPEVQRDVNPRKVSSLRRYIISGLEDTGEVSMRFFSAVTVTCKATIYYDDKHNRCLIDTHASKLSINDGQHRFNAIVSAIDTLEKDFLKSKDKERTAKLKRMIDSLKEMSIPIVIFDDLSISEEKMLFHDLNNLAQRPSLNSNIRLNQTDLYAKMAREIAVSNRYLEFYGIEMDKMSISGKNNKNTILLSTIYGSTKELLSFGSRYNKDYLNEDNYDDLKVIVNDTFTKMFSALPTDINIRGKYLIEKSFTIKAISRFICHARNHLDLMSSEDDIFKAISQVDWSYNIEIWSNYGGIEGSNGNIVFGGGSVSGVKAVYSVLIEELENIVAEK